MPSGRVPQPVKIKMPKLTEKQRKFCELYNGENLVDAVMQAGYECTSTRSAQVQGNTLLRMPKIVETLTGQDILQRRKDIADKNERMRFLTWVMRDSEQPILARLRACELMGKAFGDYVERHEIEVNSEVLVLSQKMNLDTLKLARQLADRLIAPVEEGEDDAEVVDVEPLTESSGEVADSAVCA